jgi:pyruvate dehydrogenase phosphatase
MNGNKKNWTEYVTQWLTMHACQQRLRHCYVKGRLQPTRSFGDFYLKYEVLSYDKETQRCVSVCVCVCLEINVLIFSPLLKEGKSFPYITVVPDITIHKRKMNSVKWGSENKCSFIVLASDGVWDFLTKEEVHDNV